MKTFGCVDRVLVLAAHADDETLGAGGTIRRLVDEGAAVRVAVATDSTSAQYPADQEMSERRWSAFREALSLLGAQQLDHLEAPDMALDSLPMPALAQWVQRAVSEFQPQVVLSTSPFDANRDHRLLAEATGIACRPTPGSPVTALAWYETPSSTEWGHLQGLAQFSPNVAINIEGTLDVKCEALTIYGDELRAFPHPRSPDASRHLAHTRGSQFGLEAGEIFHQVYARG